MNNVAKHCVSYSSNQHAEGAMNRLFTWSALACPLGVLTPVSLDRPYWLQTVAGCTPSMLSCRPSANLTMIDYRLTHCRLHHCMSDVHQSDRRASFLTPPRQVISYKLAEISWICRASQSRRLRSSVAIVLI